MKKYILYILFFIQNIQAQSITDWKNDFLQGKVLSKVEKTYFFGRYVGSETRYYDSFGHCTSITNRNEFGTIEYLTYFEITNNIKTSYWIKYPDTTNPIRSIHKFNSHDQLVSSLESEEIIKYYYDQFGNRIKTEHKHFSNNALNSIVIASFDNLGNCIEEKRINSNGDTIILIRKSIKYNSNGQILSTTTNDKIDHFTYNSKGNLLFRRTFDNAGKLVNETSFNYDLNNNVLEEKTINGEKQIDVIKRNIYDFRGNLVSSKLINSEGVEFHKKEIQFQYY